MEKGKNERKRRLNNKTERLKRISSVRGSRAPLDEGPHRPQDKKRSKKEDPNRRERNRTPLLLGEVLAVEDE